MAIYDPMDAIIWQLQKYQAKFNKTLAFIRVTCRTCSEKNYPLNPAGRGDTDDPCRGCPARGKLPDNLRDITGAKPTE